ncbi:Zinc metalloprotease (elastase) [Streptomyces sp. AmelKG-E11A]|nr:Zinc metalloprotease (elastase) [Streptomyces sp. AmelKG-E11A]
MNHLPERPRAVFTDADNVWGDGGGTTLQTQAADAAHGAQVTWDYYKGVHGRNGLRNDGVGRAAAERIWYRALTVYMTSNTDYAGARTATLAAAADLYGVSSPTYTRVMDARGAVNVGTRSGNPAPRPPGPAFENLTDVPIPDAPSIGTAGAPAFSSIDVSGVTDAALARIEVDIVHGGVLYVDLVAPDGTVYRLKDIYDGAPVTATHTLDLSPEAPNGTRRLRVQDTTMGGVGHISGWRMTF